MWKSDEELGDYQSGDKGGPQGNQSASGAAFLFGQSSANLFSSSSTSNPFASKPSGFSSSGFGSTVSSPAFTFLQSLTPSSPFGSTSSTSSLFRSQSPAFTPSMFSTTGSSTFGLSNSLFGTSLARGTTNTFGPSPNFSNSQPLPFFHSSTPSMPPSSSPCGQSLSFFGQTTSAFQKAFNPPSSGFGGNMFASTPSFGQTNIMRDPYTGRGFRFISYVSLDASNAATEAMNGQHLCNRSCPCEKDTIGERHGTLSERLLLCGMNIPCAMRKLTHPMSKQHLKEHDAMSEQEVDQNGDDMMDDRGLKFLLSNPKPKPRVKDSVENKTCCVLTGLIIGGSIVLVGVAGIIVLSQKCDNLLAEIKLGREGVLSEFKLTISHINAILDGWEAAGYPPLVSLISF